MGQGELLESLRRTGWFGGQLLAFSAVDGRTDFDGGLVARTAFDGPGIEVMLPGKCRALFPTTSLSRHAVSGDWFCLDGPPPIRGVFLDAHHLLIDGPIEIVHAESGIRFIKSGNRTLIGASSPFDSAKVDEDFDASLQKRQEWLRRVRPPAGLSQAASGTFAKALSILKTQVYSPEGRIRHRWTTPDRWPHRKMWLWDSAFHALGWRHIDPGIARDAIMAVFDLQAPDGFVAHMATPVATSTITQPPVLALSARWIDDICPDPGWIETLYPRLCAYVEWDLRNRDSDRNGLLEWVVEGDPQCRCGESGMDNSPRFDASTRLDAVDFNSFVSLECETIAKFALALGDEADAARWGARHAELNQLISKCLWSEDQGFFVDYDIERQEPSKVLASSGFLPLICGAASNAQAARLAECMADPALFGTAFPVPSIAAKDDRFYSKDMWRGPVWINLNWLIAEGFERYGYSEAADNLRSQTMLQIERDHEASGSLFEFYDDRGEIPPPDLLRKGKAASMESPYHQVIHDYGWTAALYVDLVYRKNHDSLQ